MQTLGMLLKKKRQLLNSHILHLAFALVGTVDSGRETTAIPNSTAFDDLLCDLEACFNFKLQISVEAPCRRVNYYFRVFFRSGERLPVICRNHYASTSTSF